MLFNSYDRTVVLDLPFALKFAYCGGSEMSQRRASVGRRRAQPREGGGGDVLGLIGVSSSILPYTLRINLF